MQNMKNLFLFITLLIFNIAVVQAQMSKESLKNLEQRYPVLTSNYAGKFQNLSVEYIVAIDLSGSMRMKTNDNSTTYLDAVKSGLVQFLQAIPDNCKISIVGFGETVRWVQLPVAVTPESRSNIAANINGLKAEESATDLKGAVNYLIEGCTSQSTIKYLFAFTDFDNSPPANSPFLSTSWNDLQQKFALIQKTSLIETFALKLPLAENAGKDLPEVRKVFPGLNVIDFNSTTLQSWFNDRSSKLAEQNLWTFVSGELKKIRERQSLNIKTRLRYDGELNLTAKPDSISGLFSGIDFFTFDSISISNGNKFKFSAGKLMFDNPSINIGGLSRNESWYPFGIVKHLSGIVKGKIITNAEQELEMLFTNVTVSSRGGTDLSVGLDEYLTYSSPVKAKGGFMIFWPVWAFIATVVGLFAIIILTLINSILPYKLRHYAVKINGGDMIPLKARYKYILSNDKGDKVIHIPEKFELEIYGAKADPSNLIIRKTIAIKINHSGHTLAVDGKLLPQSKAYRLPCNKKILLSLGTSQISFEFFRV